MFFSRERYGDITALLRLYGCVAATEWPGVIVVQLTTDNDRSKRSDVEVE